MADENHQNEPTFNIERIYLKDLSLEQPNSPDIFTANEQPTLDISFSVSEKQIDEKAGLFEVTVKATAQTNLANKQTVFLVEATQAGIFTINNIPEEHVNPLLGIRCPQILYPYLRANIANAVTAASFPPLNLPEISFEQIFQQRQEQQKTAN